VGGGDLGQRGLDRERELEDRVDFVELGHGRSLLDSVRGTY
jgi:hypothetical protein